MFGTYKIKQVASSARVKQLFFLSKIRQMFFSFKYKPNNEINIVTKNAE